MIYELEQRDEKWFLMKRRNLFNISQDGVIEWYAGTDKIKAINVMNRLNNGANSKAHIQARADGLYIMWEDHVFGCESIGYNKVIEYTQEPEYTKEDFENLFSQSPLYHVKLPDKLHREQVWLLTYSAALKNDFRISDAVKIADDTLGKFDSLFTVKTQL